MSEHLKAGDRALFHLDSAFHLITPCRVIQGESRSILEPLLLRD
jgi:hypothetical protein